MNGSSDSSEEDKELNQQEEGNESDSSSSEEQDFTHIVDRTDRRLIEVLDSQRYRVDQLVENCQSESLSPNVHERAGARFPNQLIEKEMTVQESDAISLANA